MEEQEKHFYAIINLRNRTQFFDHLLRRIWEKLEQDCLVKILFYDGYIRLFTEFYDYMRSEGVMPFVILREAEIIGLWWLNTFKEIEGQNTARIHFSGFKNSIGLRRKSPHFGTKAIRLALSLRDKKGFLINKLFGLTPSTYKLALKYNERAGMQVLDKVPDACILAYEHRTVDGILTYATRETMGLTEGELEKNLWIE